MSMFGAAQESNNHDDVAIMTVTINVTMSSQHEGEDAVLGAGGGAGDVDSSKVTMTNFLAVQWALFGAMITLVCILAYLIFPVVRQSILRIMPVSRARINLRYKTVEKWLISKRVRAYDATSEKVCRPHNTCKDHNNCVGVELRSSSSDPEEADHSSFKDGRGCPICMEAYTIDDVVSWSPMWHPEESESHDGCRDVFHHECIKEWLLHNVKCPCCRQEILPIDVEGLKLDDEVLKDLYRRRAEKSSLTYYCQVSGLVTLKEPGDCTKAQRRIARVINEQVEFAEMSKLRKYSSDSKKCCNLLPLWSRDLNVSASGETTQQDETAS